MTGSERFQPFADVVRDWRLILGAASLLAILAPVSGAIRGGDFISQVTLSVNPGVIEAGALAGVDGGDSRRVQTVAGIVAGDAVMRLAATEVKTGPSEVRDAITVRVVEASDLVRIEARGATADDARQLATAVVDATVVWLQTQGVEELTRRVESLDAVVEQAGAQAEGQGIRSREATERLDALVAQQEALRSAATGFTAPLAVLSAPGEPVSTVPGVPVSTLTGGVLGVALGCFLALFRSTTPGRRGGVRRLRNRPGA